MVFKAYSLLFGKSEARALAGVAQWIEHWSVNQRASCLTPSQDTCLCCSQVPSWGHARGNHTLMFLPFFLLPFPPL